MEWLVACCDAIARDCTEVRLCAASVALDAVICWAGRDLSAVAIHERLCVIHDSQVNWRIR